jgi:hypothetical protein
MHHVDESQWWKKTVCFQQYKILQSQYPSQRVSKQFDVWDDNSNIVYAYTHALTSERSTINLL